MTTPTSPPSIDAAPTTPLRTMARDLFNTTVAAFLAWIARAVGTQVPALAAWMFTTAGNVSTDASTASTAATTATTQAGVATTQAAAAAASAAAAAGSAGTAAGFTGTSASSMTIGAGTFTPTLSLNKQWVAGDWLLLADSGAPTTNWMLAQVGSYTPGTGASSLTVAAGNFAGSGTKTSWIVSLSGPPGPTGSGFTGGTMSTPVNWATAPTVASATTTDIAGASSNYVKVSNSVTITGLGTAAQGAERLVLFTGAPLLTYNASSLILPGAANIQVVAGDTARFISEGSGNWRCTEYTRATGAALTGSIPDVIVQDQQTGGTAGQTLTANAYNTRRLNTLVRNNNSIGSLASDKVTLQAGTYVMRGRASFKPGSAGVATQLQIYNNTDSAIVAQGENIIGDSTAAYTILMAVGPVVVTITGAKDFLLRQHIPSAVSATGGAALNDGDLEIYSTLEITKVA